MVKYYNANERWVTTMICMNDIVVGHMPCKISSVCSIFIRHGGCITCTVTGRCQYLADLVQGEWKCLAS